MVDCDISIWKILIILGIGIIIGGVGGLSVSDLKHDDYGDGYD